MSAPDALIEFTRQWWLKAVEDLEAAKSVRHLPTTCCFHCQQAVEKAIKTIHIMHQVEFERTHDIGKLLRGLAATPTRPPESMIEPLRLLSRFAVETRYPPVAATPQEATDALEKAEKFLLWVRTALPDSV